MALMAPVENGQIVESTSQSSLKNTSKTSNDTMDKDAFLQLLVAQMKYQDPLQPTSNTEYISQYAQFSQVEQMQNMASSMDLQRASSLVGQEVYIKTTTSTGETKYVQGKVDYVVYENGKAYEFVASINKLPNINAVDMSVADDIDELQKIYEEMTDYEKSFVASDVVTTLNQYIEKVKQIRLVEGESGDTEGTDENENAGDDTTE